MDMSKYLKLAKSAIFQKNQISYPKMNLEIILDASNMGMYYNICKNDMLKSNPNLIIKNNKIFLTLNDLEELKSILIRFIPNKDFEDVYNYLKQETLIIENLNEIIKTNKMLSTFKLLSYINKFKYLTDSTNIGLLTLCKDELLSRIPIIRTIIRLKEEKQL